MKIGTKSLLFGAHQFLIHPWFVAMGWWKLYGFPWDPRLWVAFFVHDLGYVGKPNMDGPEGEQHPFLGADLMSYFFGEEWGRFCLYHSRYLAKKHGRRFSRLCVADKLAIALTPAWLYLPMVRLTGELNEYMGRASARSAGNDHLTEEERRRVTAPTPREWYKGVQSYLARWVEEHKDGRDDTWTSSVKNREVVNANAVASNGKAVRE